MLLVALPLGLPGFFFSLFYDSPFSLLFIYLFGHVLSHCLFAMENNFNITYCFFYIMFIESKFLCLFIGRKQYLSVNCWDYFFSTVNWHKNLEQVYKCVCVWTRWLVNGDLQDKIPMINTNLRKFSILRGMTEMDK